MGRLVASVHVTDPADGRRIVLEAGEEPPARLAALVPNPACWENGELPSPAAPDTDSTSDTDDGPANASGVAADKTRASEPDTDSEDTKPAAKRAATRPARGRKAAAQGTGGQ